MEFRKAIVSQVIVWETDCHYVDNIDYNKNNDLSNTTDSLAYTPTFDKKPFIFNERLIKNVSV